MGARADGRVFRDPAGTSAHIVPSYAESQGFAVIKVCRLPETAANARVRGARADIPERAAANPMRL
jgi:hypothetical protein